MWPFSRRPAPRILADRIVSLGGLCEVAYQARRIGRSETAYPFDWWITPLARVAPVLEAGAAAQFAAADLEKLADYGGKRALYSRRAGTIHLHEFPAGEDFLALDVAEISARLVPKYEALDSRLRAACASGTTLFVRQRLSDHDPEGADLEEDLDRLWSALRLLAADPRLLLLDYPPVRPRAGQITAAVPRFRDQAIVCRTVGRGGRIDDLLVTNYPRRR
ncbi:DUF1796 family putative cysteine peptidase [Xanthobacter sp. KR7-65]|uniref:DUF1796 family putative cysteine peptidase n=1 Tax=Xanthobacter sp. KR7-65 TaxID=3156612 RepID=UPI0032B3933E